MSTAVGRPVAPGKKKRETYVASLITVAEGKQFKAFCESNDISQSDVIRKLICAHLERNGLLKTGRK